MQRLLFVLAASMVPAALLGTLLVGYDYYERERGRLIRDSTATTRALVAAVDTDFTATRSALMVLAASPALRAGDLAGFHAQALAALQDLPIANVVLLDRRGGQLVNTRLRFGEALPRQDDASGLQRVFESGAAAVSDLFVGPVAQRPLFAIGVPIKRGGEVVHVLAAGLAPERLSALVSEQKLPPGWIAGVFDSQGTIVARTQEAERFVGQKGSPELLRRMKEAREDALEARTLEGIPVLTVFTRSAASGWTVAIGIPLSELNATVFESIARLFLVAFIVLLSALGLAVALGRRMLRERA
jgi:hypothetical protein